MKIHSEKLEINKTIYQLPTTNYQLPTTNYQLPTTLRVQQSLMGETPKTALLYQLPIRLGKVWGTETDTPNFTAKSKI
ncbi:MAG: hypothetical protein AAFY50_25455 [Cyanobacteria bacterium J06648_1]